MPDAPKLTRVTRLDSVSAGKAEWTAEGFLTDKPIVTSVGIFEYRNEDGSVRRELRLPEHVFAPESLASYKGKPVVITHNAGIVTKENAPDEVIGAILSEGVTDGDDVRAEIIIHDTDAMKQSGFKELSLGYNLTLDETPGEWNGQPYDAVQTGITINHLALVGKARAGEDARLNIDGKEPENPEGGKLLMAKDKKPTMDADELKKALAAFEKRRKARMDGEDEPSAIPEKITIEGVIKPQEGATDAGTNPVASEDKSKEMTLAEKVQSVKDRRDKRDGFGDPEDIEGAKGVIAQQDEDISVLLELLEKLQAAKDLAAAPIAADGAGAVTDGGANDDAKKDGDGEKLMNTDSVDAIVSERLKLARVGDKLNLDGIEQLKPLDAKKKIVMTINPNIRLDGKSAAYIDTAFDIAMTEYESRKDTNYQRKQMFNADGKAKPPASGGARANGEADAGAVKFGMGVVIGANPGKDVKLPDASDTPDKFEGVVMTGVKSMDLEGNTAIDSAFTLGILKWGKPWVRIDDGLTISYGDPVYLIVNGAAKGLFSNDDADAIAVNARFIGGAESGDIAPIELYNQSSAVAAALADLETRVAALENA
jgi:hypothetical protein